MRKPVSVTIVPWLKANLGKNALAGNTGTDQKALEAAVQIAELISYERGNPSLPIAFGLVVRAMQEKQRFLAFHAIAHVMDWSDRETIWKRADLWALENIPRCEFEPSRRAPDATVCAEVAP